MPFQWETGLETGNDRIDEDHRHLFALANRYADAIAHGAGPLALDEVLGALARHAQAHFEREEQLMREINYPETEFHVRHHTQMAFMLRTFLMRKRLAQTPDTKGALSEETMAFLDDWIRLHIQCFDKRLVDYVHEQQAATAATRPGGA